MERMIRFAAYIGGGSVSDYSGNQCKAEPLFITDSMDDYFIESATITLEVNKVSSFEFVIAVEHPLASKIEKFRNWVFVNEEIINVDTGNSIDSQVLFYGRVTSVDTDLYGNKTVMCESSFGFLNDAVSKPNDYGFTTIAQFASYAIIYGYQSVVDQDTSVEGIKYAYKRITWSDDSDSSSIESEIKEDASNDNILNIITKYTIDEAGGFISVEYYPNGLTSLLKGQSQYLYGAETILRYYTFYENSPNFGIGIQTYNPLRKYPHEESDEIIIDGDPYTWLPYFCVGRNIVSLSKEPALETLFTGVYPVGKDNILLQTSSQSNSYRFLWNTSAVNKYGRIAIPISFPEVSNRTNLKTLSQNWLARHISDDLFNEFKYTVTGPEPAVIGCGNKLVRLMCSVMYSEDRNKALNKYDSYPCLSMKIDVFNPQNNQYTFGPFVSDNYSETNISSSKDYAK